MQEQTPSAPASGTSGPLTPAARLERVPTFRAASYPVFRRLWTAAVLIAFGNWMERLTLGWLVLDQTGSIFLTALVFAVRHAPNIVFGPIAGAVADRVERKRVLALAALVRAVLVLAMGGIVLTGFPAVWPLMVLAALSGIAHTFETPSTQPLVTDIVDRRDAMNGIALLSFGMRAIGVLGALVGGVMIEVLNAGPVLISAAVVFATGAAVATTIRTGRTTTTPSPGGSFLRNAFVGLGVLLTTPVVAALVLLAVVVEILAFSYQSMLPVVAADVLEVGPAGLGTMTLMAGVGSLLGSAALTTLGDFSRKGLLILMVTLSYGMFLVAFGISGLFPLSLVLLVGVGAMAASFDALQWILLQEKVPDEMRGRAIGGWVFAIGFGWIGPLALGGLAEVIGVQLAIAGSGALVIALAIGAFAGAGQLRRA